MGRNKKHNTTNPCANKNFDLQNGNIKYEKAYTVRRMKRRPSQKEKGEDKVIISNKEMKDMGRSKKHYMLLSCNKPKEKIIIQELKKNYGMGKNRMTAICKVVILLLLILV